MGGVKIYSPKFLLDTMWLDFFFYLITFFSKCQKNRIDKNPRTLRNNFSTNIQLAKIDLSV